ncbi:unnamed protein product [Chrysoparadoxa australica]
MEEEGYDSENENDAIEIPRPLQIGDEFPNFTGDSHMGQVILHDLIDGSWGLVFLFPKSSDPVACTEMGMLSKLRDEFDARHVKLLAVGVDSKLGQRAFIKETQELQDCEINFPLVADVSGAIFYQLGLVRPDAVDPSQALLPQTTIFVIDIDKRVKLMSQYPASVGHNYYELIRAIDALQLATFHQVGIPANWKEGEDVFIQPSIRANQIAQLFPKGSVEIKPWFRITPQPDYE